MKILLINQVFYPDVVATAQQLSDFAVDLAKKGHEVTALASRRGYTEPYTLFRKQESYKGVRIIRVCPWTLGRKFKFLRLLDALMVNAAFAWKLLWMQPFDKVVALTSPPLVAWLALLFTRVKGGEFTFWVMDMNLDRAVKAGWLKSGSIIQALLKKIFQFVLKNSQKVVVLDEFMRDRVVAKVSVKDATNLIRKIEIISPWAPGEGLKNIPHGKNPFRRHHKLGRKFVVMYSGNHGIGHPLDTILKSARLLKKESSIVFMFVGEGERVQEVLEFKKRYRLKNILHLPYQELSQLQYSLSAADLQAVVMENAYAGIIHPCKIYGILQTGQPFVFIGPKRSSIGQMIQKNRVGYHVHHGDAHRLVEVICKVKKLSSTAKKGILEKEKEISKRHSRSIMSGKLIRFLLKPLKQSSGYRQPVPSHSSRRPKHRALKVQIHPPGYQALALALKRKFHWPLWR